jgi:hypothetical protein
MLGCSEAEHSALDALGDHAVPDATVADAALLDAALVDAAEADLAWPDLAPPDRSVDAAQPDPAVDAAQPAAADAEPLDAEVDAEVDAAADAEVDAQPPTICERQAQAPDCAAHGCTWLDDTCQFIEAEAPCAPVPLFACTRLDCAVVNFDCARTTAAPCWALDAARCSLRADCAHTERGCQTPQINPCPAMPWPACVHDARCIWRPDPCPDCAQQEHRAFPTGQCTDAAASPCALPRAECLQSDECTWADTGCQEPGQRCAAGTDLTCFDLAGCHLVPYRHCQPISGTDEPCRWLEPFICEPQ